MTQSSSELDPLFLKAIALLRSRHPDSPKQLKELVDDYRQKTYGVSIFKVSKKPEPDDIEVKPEVDSVKLESNVITSVIQSKSNSSSPVRVEEMVTQVSYFVEETSNAGSITSNIEEIEEVSLGSSFEPKAKKSKRNGLANDDMSPYSDSDPNDSIPIDDIIEMDFDGPSCRVCHMNRRSENDEMVECSECHENYHQKCHKPPVPTNEVNDPRLCWYCSKCTKKFNNMTARSSTQHSKPSVVLPTQQTSNNPPKTNTPKANPFQQAKPFRRNIASTEPSNMKKNLSNATDVTALTGVNLSPMIKLDRVSPPVSTSREGSPVLKKMGRIASPTPKKLGREGSPNPKQVSKVSSDVQSNANTMTRQESVKKKGGKQKKNGK